MQHLQMSGQVVRYKYINVGASMLMRQHINNNWIAYTLLAGLFVCGVVFVATPVMAQDITNAELKASIDNLKNNEGEFGITEIVGVIIGGLIVAGVGFLIKRVWGFPTFVKDLENIINDFKNHKHTQEDGSVVLVVRGSPLNLTDEGKEYFKNSGCKAYFRKHLKEWSRHFEELNEDYLIHDRAREFMNDHYKQSTDPNFKNIKAYLFNEGVSHEQIMLMLSVGLRDMICEEKGIVIKKKEQQQVQK